MKRTISLVLVVLMILTIVPMDIFATDLIAEAKKALEDKITEATQLSNSEKRPDGTEENTVEKDLKYYLESDVNTLKNAITVATEAKDNQNATEQSLNEAKTTLDTAINTFKSKVKTGTKPVDKTELQTAITTAKQKLEGVVASEETDASKIEKDKKVATQEEIDKLKKAITDAEAVVNNQEAKQSDVDNAKSTLETATAAFNPIVGTKEIVKKDKLLAAITEAKKYQNIVVLDDTTKEADVKAGTEYILKKDEDKKTVLIEEIKLAEAIYSNSVVTQAQVDEETEKIKTATKSLTDVKKVGSKVEPAKIKVFLYENYNKDHKEYQIKEYDVQTKIKDVDIYSRRYYKFIGWSYTRDGKLIDGNTRIGDLSYKDLFAQWRYTGNYDDYYYGYYRPESLEWTYGKAKDFKRNYAWEIENASYDLRRNFEDAYKTVENMYDSSNWYRYGRYYDGKYFNGYFDGSDYYYNGKWYSYYDFYRKAGYYPDRYRDGRYYDGKYYNGYYDGSDYYYNGNWYSYSEFRRITGYTPYDYVDRFYDYRYDRNYDYYDYYGYYDSDYRNKLEKLIDSIRAIARYYPNRTIYNSYADLSYPDYSRDYYGYYAGSYSDKDLLNLINEGEALYKKINNSADKTILKELRSALDEASAVRRGRGNYSRAYSRLSDAINKAKPYETLKVYIRNAYMKGNTSGNFMPNSTLTRAEVSQIIANLLKQSGKTTVYMPKKYNDVSPGAWYKEAIDLASSYGIMTGKPGNLFDPQGIITKAELVTIAARIKGYEKAPGNIFGLKTHLWAQGYIQRAYVEGWIDLANGFMPAQPITRAETVHILNGALKYGPDQDYIIKQANTMVKFGDVTRTTPYYFDIITATNTISYVETNTARIWKNHKHSTGIWSNKNYSTGTSVVPLN